MSGFSDWNAPRRGEEEPPSSPLEARARELARRLPARRAPSALDGMRKAARASTGSQIGTASIYVDFTELMPNRVDGPFYTGIQGRAAICLQLSSQWVTELDDLQPVVVDGVTLHAMALTEGYPLLRTVIEFPRRMDLYFESLLDLTEGNVQEFVVDAIATELVELHFTVPGDTRALRLRCRGPRIGEVLAGTVERLCREDHPREPGLMSAASNVARMTYPIITDGLGGTSAIPLEPGETVQGIAMIHVQF